MGPPPLENGGKVVRGTAKTVTDGPYAEAKDLVSGLLVVSASSLAAAVELARGQSRAQVREELRRLLAAGVISGARLGEETIGAPSLDLASPAAAAAACCGSAARRCARSRWPRPCP